MKSFNEWVKKKHPEVLNEFFGFFKKKEIVCDLCGEVHQIDKQTGEPIIQQIFQPLKAFAYKNSKTPWLKDAKGHEFKIITGEKSPRYDDALAIYNKVNSKLRKIETEERWRKLKEKEKKEQEELEARLTREFWATPKKRTTIWGSQSSQDNVTRNRGKYG